LFPVFFVGKSLDKTFTSLVAIEPAYGFGYVENMQAAFSRPPFYDTMVRWSR